MRFRLDPHLDIRSLHLTADRPELAGAAQKFGIVVHDQAGSVVFYGKDPVTQSSKPWPATFRNQTPNNVLALFPWSHLRALRLRLTCSG